MKKNPAIALDYGKIPPQAMDLEEAVLGAIMLEKDAILSVLDILEPGSFYKEAHQQIYEVCQSLSMQEKPIDLLTVTEELRKLEKLEAVGGAVYIAQLTSRVDLQPTLNIMPVLWPRNIFSGSSSGFPLISRNGHLMKVLMWMIFWIILKESC